MLRLLTGATPLALLLLALTASPALAHDPPAGGASVEEVLVSALAGLVLLTVVAILVVTHRRGRLTGLDRIAAVSGRVSSLPGWAALPLAVAGGSLLIAVFGFYWDVATHIDHGRDDGVFGNAAHWPILIGLLGLAAAGLISLLLGTDEDSHTAVGRRARRRMPVGGALLLLCGVVALAGFPIDDVWHRIFGQDVTLWSPPHIQMVAGASLCTVAMWLLFVEAERAVPAPTRAASRRWQEVAIAGAVLIGLSTLQGEFDFGVPQFRLLYQPVMIAVAAGLALVPARLRLGRGGALLAVAFFLAMRGALSLVVSGVFDHVVFHLPLYLGAALVVEFVARWIPPQRQLTVGAWAGLGIGTVGLAVEAAWTQVAMPIAWSTAMLPEAAVIAIPAAVAAGVTGGFLARALAPVGVERQPAFAPVAPLAAIVLIAALAYPLPTTSVDTSAQMRLEGAEVDGREHAHLTVTLDEPGVVDGAAWFHVIAWQGAQWWSGERTRLWELEPVADDTYRTTEPVPVHGDWKTMVRVHNGRIMAAAPVYLPLDRAIPAQEVPARAQMTRDFVVDQQILLREMRPVPEWIHGLAHGLMALLAGAWLAAFVWATRRLRRGAQPTRQAHPGAHERSPRG